MAKPYFLKDPGWYRYLFHARSWALAGQLLICSRRALLCREKVFKAIGLPPFPLLLLKRLFLLKGKPREKDPGWYRYLSHGKALFS